MEMTLKQVIDAQNGDKVAYANICKILYKDLYRYSYSLINNKKAAKEIVIDSCAEAYLHINELEKPELFKHWIYKFLYNKCQKKYDY